MGTARARIIGIGSYLPERIVTNDELSKTIDTTHEWIVERTGIAQRHIAAKDELTSDLGAAAAAKALENASIRPDEVDAIFVATVTPDRTMPPTASAIQDKLGIRHAAACDLNAVCSGFLYGLWMANGLIASGQAKTILLVGAETFSRILDWEDRSTCILFGDGAGAVVLRAEDGETGRGVLACRTFNDGSLRKLIETDGGASLSQHAGVVHMHGREVFRHAVQKMCDALHDCLNATGLTLSDIDLAVPHQANSRILQAIAARLELPAERMMNTVSQHANTSAASIPLALDAAQQAGMLDSEKIVALQALGSGLSWGAALIKW